MIRKYYIVYDLSTGEILKDVLCAESLKSAQYNSSIEGLMELSERIDPQKYYAPSGVITARSSMGTSLSKSNILADGIDQAIISSVPAGTDVYVNKLFQEQCNDGSVEIVSDEAQAIDVELFNFPYRDQEYTIYAN